MAHFYLVTSIVSYTQKDTNQKIMEPFSCIVMGKEKIVKFTQNTLENISIFIAGKYIEQHQLNATNAKDFDRTIMGINYLGEMTKEEFVDSDEAVFKDLTGKEQIMVPAKKDVKPSKEQMN